MGSGISEENGESSISGVSGDSGIGEENVENEIIGMSGRMRLVG